MAIGIWSDAVYFLDPPPTPAQMLAGLRDMTGLSMGVASPPEDYLQLFHPDSPAWFVNVEWFTDRLDQIARQRAAVPGLPDPPFPDHPYAVYLSGDPRSSPRSHRYLITSLFWVLQACGGQVKRPRPLPDWAGKKWAEMPPLGFWSALKERWK